LLATKKMVIGLAEINDIDLCCLKLMILTCVKDVYMVGRVKIHFLLIRLGGSGGSTLKLGVSMDTPSFPQKNFCYIIYFF